MMPTSAALSRAGLTISAATASGANVKPSYSCRVEMWSEGLTRCLAVGYIQSTTTSLEPFASTSIQPKGDVGYAHVAERCTSVTSGIHSSTRDAYQGS